MGNKYQKPAGALLFQRPSRQRAVVELPERFEAADVPEPKATWPVAIQNEWRAFWTLPVLSQLELPGEMYLVVELFEWRVVQARAFRALSRDKKGQARMRLSLASRQIRMLEDRLGVSPLSRMRLGYETGRAALTAEGLRKALQEPGEDEGWIEGEIADGDRRTA